MSHAYLRAARLERVGNIQPCSKVAYDTRKQARNAMNNLEGNRSTMIAQGSGMRNVWLCPFCDCWHFGHWNKPKPSRIREGVDD